MELDAKCEELHTRRQQLKGRIARLEAALTDEACRIPVNSPIDLSYTPPTGAKAGMYSGRESSGQPRNAIARVAEDRYSPPPIKVDLLQLLRARRLTARKAFVARVGKMVWPGLPVTREDRVRPDVVVFLAFF